jgi:hypothetical protein
MSIGKIDALRLSCTVGYIFVNRNPRDLVCRFIPASTSWHRKDIVQATAASIRTVKYGNPLHTCCVNNGAVATQEGTIQKGNLGAEVLELLLQTIFFSPSPPLP